MLHALHSIDLSAAQAIVSTAIDSASRTRHRFAVAVVDPAGVLLAFARQDGAKINSVQIAQDKAYTAATSQMSTQTWSQALAGDEVLGRAAPTAIDRLAAMGGGLPIVIDDETVGAIGVSGAHWTDDTRIAEAGLAAITAEV